MDLGDRWESGVLVVGEVWIVNLLCVELQLRIGGLLGDDIKLLKSGRRHN